MKAITGWTCEEFVGYVYLTPELWSSHTGRWGSNWPNKNDDSVCQHIINMICIFNTYIHTLERITCGIISYFTRQDNIPLNKTYLHVTEKLNLLWKNCILFSCTSTMSYMILIFFKGNKHAQKKKILAWIWFSRHKKAGNWEKARREFLKIPSLPGMTLRSHPSPQRPTARVHLSSAPRSEQKHHCIHQYGRIFCLLWQLLNSYSSQFRWADSPIANWGEVIWAAEYKWSGMIDRPSHSPPCSDR